MKQASCLLPRSTRSEMCESSQFIRAEHLSHAKPRANRNSPQWLAKACVVPLLLGCMVHRDSFGKPQSRPNNFGDILNAFAFA